ncbi:YjcZ family sporulation protein [Paenibacillus anaericanus]
MNGIVGGFGECGRPKPVCCGIGTSTGVILVLFILLVIVSRACLR